MKYCPQCNRQYFEAWLTFCTNDGSLLREDLTPAADPNWDPRIREPKFDEPSEQATQWLPPDPPPGGGWIAPDERAPFTGPWQPPPPPPRSHVKPTPIPMATASFICGGVALLFGMFCGIPIPGLMAVIFGAIALSQLRNHQELPGRGFALAGMIMGGINLAIFVLWLLYLILSVAFG